MIMKSWETQLERRASKGIRDKIMEISDELQKLYDEGFILQKEYQRLSEALNNLYILYMEIFEAPTTPGKRKKRRRLMAKAYEIIREEKKIPRAVLQMKLKIGNTLMSELTQLILYYHKNIRYENGEFYLKESKTV